MSAIKNLPASVKARLLALARKRDESFNLLVPRYGVERLLYRLSQSPYAENFLLKGAMLFAVWDEKVHRPTTDVDLLVFGPADRETIARTFREIVQTPVPADGLVFDPDSITVEEIREDNTYGGVRVRLLAWLGTGEVPIQIDLGSGDVVTPAPQRQVFPPLLDFPAPHVRTYPVYTVVAEKVEAMVKLGLRNTRMKDFYDLWFLAGRFDFDGAMLHRAIHATFARRETALGNGPLYPFTSAFAGDETKQVQWTAFLGRNRLVGAPAKFADLTEMLRQFIEPALAPDAAGREWRRGSGWGAIAAPSQN